MSTNDELDRLLNGPDDGDLPRAEEFVVAAVAHVGRCLAWRRRLMLMVGVVTLASACVALFALSTHPLLRMPTSLPNILAVLLCAALCGVVWITTEDAWLPG